MVERNKEYTEAEKTREALLHMLKGLSEKFGRCEICILEDGCYRINLKGKKGRRVIINPWGGVIFLPGVGQN